MFQKQRVKDDLEKFTDPLRRDGFDEVRFRQQGRITAEITRDEAPSFTAESDEDLPGDPIGEVIDRQPQTRLWRIRQVPFDPKLKVWRFYEGDTPVKAPVLDDEFIGKVTRHEIVFGNGDFLRVNVTAITTVTPDGSSHITYEVTRVLGVISQPGLPLGGEPPAPDSE